jgi:hypothetical protein
METVRLTVRTRQGVWQDEVDSWTSLVILAALSAEPESFAELAEAVRRYQPDHQLFDPPWQSAERYEGPWCSIDLPGRTVVGGAGFELPDPRGAYEADKDDDPQGFAIVWLDTPEDWLFLSADGDWRAVVTARASARAAAPRVDSRAVLYGLPLLEHIAANILPASAGGADPTREQELVRAVHAQWLLTARGDLDGRTPREVLLAERHRISLDLDHRSHQWSSQGHAPPAIPADSMAYHFGGYGTMEVVLYFDLVRALLAQAWELVVQEPQPTQVFLIKRLAEFRDAWLEEPNEATGPSLSPAELIASERRRMPVTSDGSHLDCDCPICQAQAAGEFGPAFVCFDGHHLELEEEFAFSLCETHAEWEREQEEYRQFAAEMDRKDRERAAGGDDADSSADSVWQTSFVNWEVMAGPDASPHRAMMALGFPLSELVVDLQECPDSVDPLQSLNRAYGSLRASQDAVAMDSAAHELRNALEVTCGKFPGMTAKCADLQSRLDEVLRRIS